MRGDPLALQIKCHSKTPRARGDIFRLQFPPLKILLAPPDVIHKIIKHPIRARKDGCFSASYDENQWKGKGIFTCPINTNQE
jgi:hypothetical protein